MKIELRQSGGVAGIIRPTRTIDTDTLPEAEASRWRDLVAAADFFRLPTSIAAGPRRDAFTYVVTVEEQGRSHTVQTQQGADFPALDRLIEQLRQVPGR
jgi:hypothetical protein